MPDRRLVIHLSTHIKLSVFMSILKIQNVVGYIDSYSGLTSPTSISDEVEGVFRGRISLTCCSILHL